MINKQSVWFVTLFSLILVLSIYYVTLNDSSLKGIIENYESPDSAPVSLNVEESSLLVSLRIKEDESVLKEMEEYQNILLDNSKSSEEKSNAYNSLMTLNQKKSEEEKVEKLIKEQFDLESFAKIKNDTISIVIAKNDHSYEQANNIIRAVQELFLENKYITVKYQNA